MKLLEDVTVSFDEIEVREEINPVWNTIVDIFAPHWFETAEEREQRIASRYRTYKIPGKVTFNPIVVESHEPGELELGRKIPEVSFPFFPDAFCTTTIYGLMPIEYLGSGQWRCVLDFSVVDTHGLRD